MIVILIITITQSDKNIHKYLSIVKLHAEEENHSKIRYKPEKKVYIWLI